MAQKTRKYHTTKTNTKSKSKTKTNTQRNARTRKIVLLKASNVAKKVKVQIQNKKRTNKKSRQIKRHEKKKTNTSRITRKNKKSKKRGGQYSPGRPMIPPVRPNTAGLEPDKRRELMQQYMKDIQSYNASRAKVLVQTEEVSPSDENKNPVDKTYTQVCQNIVDENTNRNELDDLIVQNQKQHNIIFELDGKYYCYDLNTVRKIISDIQYIQVHWNMRADVDPSTISEERLNQGTGREAMIQNNEFDYYVKGNTFMSDEDGKAEYEQIISQASNERFKQAQECLVWLFPMSGRTALSESAVATLNREHDSNVVFQLKKQSKRTVIGNLFNIFGVSMVHGHLPGEFVHDIEVKYRGDVDNHKGIQELAKHYRSPSSQKLPLVDADGLIKQYNDKYDALQMAHMDDAANYDSDDETNMSWLSDSNPNNMNIGSYDTDDNQQMSPEFDRTAMDIENWRQANLGFSSYNDDSDVEGNSDEDDALISRRVRRNIFAPSSPPGTPPMTPPRTPVHGHSLSPPRTPQLRDGESVFTAETNAPNVTRRSRRRMTPSVPALIFPETPESNTSNVSSSSPQEVNTTPPPNVRVTRGSTRRALERRR